MLASGEAVLIFSRMTSRAGQPCEVIATSISTRYRGTITGYNGVGCDGDAVDESKVDDGDGQRRVVDVGAVS